MTHFFHTLCSCGVARLNTVQCHLKAGWNKGQWITRSLGSSAKLCLFMNSGPQLRLIPVLKRTKTLSLLQVFLDSLRVVMSSTDSIKVHRFLTPLCCEHQGITSTRALLGCGWQQLCLLTVLTIKQLFKADSGFHSLNFFLGDRGLPLSLRFMQARDVFLKGLTGGAVGR